MMSPLAVWYCLFFLIFGLKGCSFSTDLRRFSIFALRASTSWLYSLSTTLPWFVFKYSVFTLTSGANVHPSSSSMSSFFSFAWRICSCLLLRKMASAYNRSWVAPWDPLALRCGLISFGVNVHSSSSLSSKPVSLSFTRLGSDRREKVSSCVAGSILSRGRSSVGEKVQSFISSLPFSFIRLRRRSWYLFACSNRRLDALLPRVAFDLLTFVFVLGANEHFASSSLSFWSLSFSFFSFSLRGL
mmetsp:Transcript_13215/g.19064  ORF Transcript_13215/g.19064 Transcript_13215/m.19064 type:complete len:243 (+) Transcript_13215:328-1056(+)